MIRCENYYRRKRLMSDPYDLPTLTEITEVLGAPLATVFFEQCPEALRGEIGLRPLLEGAGTALWNSPSDILIGKVVLKPPITTTCTKALTHKGILELGFEVEKKLQRITEEQQQMALRLQEKYLREIFADELAQAVINAKAEAEAYFMKKVQGTQGEFEERLQAELQILEEQLNAEYAKKLEDEKNRYEGTFKELLEETIEDLVTSMTKKFLEDMMIQERELTEKYERILQQNKIANMLQVQEEQHKCRESMNQLNHSLQCQNLANIMYILCLERYRCEADRKKVEELYQSKVIELTQAYERNQCSLIAASKELEVLKNKYTVREECTKEVIKQFQKFINFILKAHPQHAEFLLDVEKMLSLELYKTLAPPKKPQECGQILYGSKVSSTSLSSKESLSLRNYHDCNKMRTPYPSEENMKDLLPIIKYKNEIYMREDFRNMCSVGIEISPSNLLWSKDVNDAQLIYRKAAEEQNDSLEIGHLVKLQTSIASSVRFGKEKSDSISSNEKKIRPILSVGVPEHEPNETEQIRYTTVDSLGLLVTKDSLTKHRESLTTQTGSPPSPLLKEVKLPDDEELPKSLKLMQAEANAIAKKTKDSVILAAQQRTTLTRNSSLQSTASKLTEARNSVVLAKLSIKKDMIIPNDSISSSILTDDHSVQEVVSDARRGSRLSFARDSLILHKQNISIQSKDQDEMIKELTLRDKPVRSSLKHHLEYMMYESKEPVRNMSLHKDSVELLREKPRKKRTDYQSLAKGPMAKVVRPGRGRPTVVAFKTVPQIHSVENCECYEKYWSESSSSSESGFSRSKLPDLKNQAKIMGNKHLKAHKKPLEEFTADRVGSLLGILEKDSSLMRMFTKATQ